MALSSPRFRGVPQLEQAAHSAPYLHTGDRGHGVHLLQMALIELGFPMPKSTGGHGFSPDGIYGAETKAQVDAFQRSTLGGPPIDHDGAAGQYTMAKLDRAAAGCTHRVHLQVSFTSKPAVPMATQVQVAREVYGRYGIAIVDFPVDGFYFPHDEDQGFFDENPDFNEQKARLKDKSSLTPSPNSISVVFIEGFATGRAVGDSQWDTTGAIIRITERAFETTLAHEIGHVLQARTSAESGVDHKSHQHNIMLDGTPPAKPRVLTAGQVARMKANGRCF